MTTVCILYPGDMGGAVARRLTAAGVRVVTCLSGRSPRTAGIAAEASVEVLPTLAAAVGAAQTVVSLVPQSAARGVAGDVAAAVAGQTSPRPLYVDANSVAPATVAELATTLSEAAVDCVDGGFIGSARELGGRTTLYLSGARAAEAAGAFGDAFPVRVLDDAVGTASAFKLSIYAFNKGLVAMFLEMMSAADAVGQRRELLACLRRFYEGSVATAERLLPTYPRHAARRADELTEVVEWLESIEEPSAMARATRDVLAELATVDFGDAASWDADAVVSRFCEARHARGGSAPRRDDHGEGG